MILAALSTSYAFKSGSLVCAISKSFALEIVATLVFLEFEEPFDGEVKLPNYDKIQISMDDIFEFVWNNNLEKLQKDYYRYDNVDKDSIITKDSIVCLNLISDMNGSKTTHDEVYYDLKQISWSEEWQEEFEKQVIGKKGGDSGKMELTFADVPQFLVYGEEDSPAVFTYEIVGVAEEIHPEINDEFIKEVFDFDTLEEYKEDYLFELGNLLYSDEDKYNEFVKSAIERYFLENTDILKQATPILNLSKEESDKALELASNYAGITTEMYLKNAYKMTYEEYIKYYANNFGNRDTLFIILAYQEGLNSLDELYRQYMIDSIDENDDENLVGFLAEKTDEEKIELTKNSSGYIESGMKREFIRDIVLNKLLEEKVEIIPATKYTVEYILGVDENDFNDVLNIQTAPEEE